MSSELICQSIRFSDAAAFYNAYEHLGNPGRGVYHWGAFYNGVLVGAVSFGTACFALHRGLFSQIASEFHLRVYQLTRGGTAPDAPRFTGSWIVSQGLKNIRLLRGDSIIVAYSDPHFNEIGTIYQAANFFCLGKTDPKGQSDYFIEGKFMSGWKVRRRFGTRDVKKLRAIKADVVRMPLHPKYRYIFLATGQATRKAIIDKIRHRIVAYPKRHEEGVAAMDPSALIKNRTECASVTRMP